VVSGDSRAVVRPSPPIVIASLLFVASAGFVWWRNTQVGVLVDLGYVVNIATRIALGDVPYRDFPLAQAPGSFLAQALLIKLFGPHYLVQIAYASALGGAATALAYRIVRRLLAGAVPSPDGLALVLTLPLIPLGIYAVVPNPFYDPDACLVVLGAIALLLAARDRPTVARFAAAGAVATMPLFIKQNIGGAFIISLAGILVAEALARPARRRELGWLGVGAGAALALQITVLEIVVGIDAYVRWAWTFAMSGRGVTADRIREFGDPIVLFPAALIVLLAIGAPRVAERIRWLLFAGALAVAAAATPAASIALQMAPLLLPPLLVAAAALGLARAAREGPHLEVLLPLVLVATTLGTLQSQGLVNSTFGIFPLLTLALACVVRDLARAVPRPLRLAPLTGVVIALIATVVGTVSTIENVRLRFIHVNGPGPVVASAYPSLVGLSARGPYLAELDAVLYWMRDNVPPADGFVFLPGEDPVFFALGRKPALPSVYFYDVATPYAPAELARIADQVGLRWVIVKDPLQLTVAPPLEPELVARLTDRAALVATVGPYRVFRR
jgi:hypothetical protein